MISCVYLLYLVPVNADQMTIMSCTDVDNDLDVGVIVEYLISPKIGTVLRRWITPIP